MNKLQLEASCRERSRALAGICVFRKQSPSSMREDFNRWMIEHGVVYGDRLRHLGRLSILINRCRGEWEGSEGDG